MNEVTDKNYIVIQSFMVSELGLKGNELLIYAIIFGFSQTTGQAFHGSLTYLESWTNSTRPTVISSLKSLVEKGLIEKEEQTINGVKYCSYRAKNSTDKAEEVVKKFNEGSKEILPNNILYNIVDNIVDNNIVENAEKYDMKTITEIVDYLNEKAHKNYRSNNKATMRHINARLKEGRTLSDFKQVIDNRCATWLGTDMEQYLRPETLFGSKFEGYLNASAPKRRGSDGRLLGEKSNGWEFVFGDD
ncbi:conserved phage C-terminal domain-containing protein [Segatella sp.]|uniref:conserved phage C-terminal domain-containing protein n=1 Tax=Segatella sp. TaxID=2974253 RepID=UPI003AB1E6D2